MHDKQIRRRRAALALLVAISLILLTDYFGESPASPLHSVQRGIADVFSPIQDGASRIFSPVRDVTGWISSTIHAKSQVSQLQRENAQLKTQVADDQYDASQYAQDQSLLHQDDANGMKQYDPVTASVTAKDPVLWYDTIEVDKGTDAGVHLLDPVIGQGGLVGNVTQVGSGYADITLITAPKFQAGAMIENGHGASGILGTSGGQLQVNYLPASAQVAYGQAVVTSGFKDSADPSIQSEYPPGILIGSVSNRNPQESVLDNQRVDVTPSVNLQHISVVQILARPHK